MRCAGPAARACSRVLTSGSRKTGSTAQTRRPSWSRSCAVAGTYAPPTRSSTRPTSSGHCGGTPGAASSTQTTMSARARAASGAAFRIRLESSMPAPQASAMQPLARLKFTSFNRKVPDKWQQPSGDPCAKHYSDAFEPSEKATTPGMPPLFQPASLNKYHTETQKMHIDKIGKFIDGTCSAICSAWSQWQTAATMVGVVITAVTAVGGQIVGPPWTPLLLASAAKSTPMEMKFSANELMTQMVGQLGDPNAPFHLQLFEAIADAFEKTYNLWKVSTLVTNVLGTGPVPTFAPPSVPVGPVVGGVGTMTPGGFT